MAAFTLSQPNQTDQPDAARIAYLASIEAVETCRAVYGGTRAMREAGDRFLPRFPLEEDDAYEDRLARAVLYNAFKRTVKGLAGMAFRKDPALEDDVPIEIRGQEADPDTGQELVIGHAENIDLAGRHLSVFARDVFEAKLIDGHTFIFVDWWGADDARSRAEEREARPYWVHILRQQVIRWRAESFGGRTVLVSFAYIETDTEPDGEFGERLIRRVRQYDLVESDGETVSAAGTRVRYRSWVQDVETTGGAWQVEEPGRLLGERMTRIPVVCDYADRAGFFESDPPLLDLAYENIRHYQLRSDRDTLLHTSHVPVFTLIGVSRDQVAQMSIGAGTGLVLDNPQAKAQYTEASGTGLAQSRDELKDTEQRMAAMGLAMLQRETRAAETAEAKRIDKAENDSQLAVMVRATGDALEEALWLHAMWMGLPDGGSVSMNDDFGIEPLEPQMVQALAGLVRDNMLSLDTLWDLLKSGNILPDGFNAELERARIEDQAGASLDALLALSRREREDAEGAGGEGDDAGGDEGDAERRAA